MNHEVSTSNSPSYIMAFCVFFRCIFCAYIAVSCGECYYSYLSCNIFYSQNCYPQQTPYNRYLLHIVISPFQYSFGIQPYQPFTYYRHRYSHIPTNH